MASAEVRPGPEVLAFGPRPTRPRSWRPLVIGLLVAVLLGAGGATWWLVREQPSDDLTFADLQDVYAGMVRADGTNDSAVVSRDQPRPAPVPVDPLGCLPLVETTLAEQLPAAALDGVSTYWLGEGAASAISLFTLRYPDAETAAGQYDGIVAALPDCPEVTVGPGTGRVTATEVSYANGVPSQLGYLVTMTTGDRYAIAVLRYENTVTWQFRLEVGNAPYEPYAAQQLMDALVAQVRAVQELKQQR